jgi:hypothetical protein
MNMEINQERDIKIRTILLFEFYNQLYGQSKNTGHYYILPELQDIDNQIIDANAIYLIDENLVRGDVEYAGSNSLPYITRINSTGMKLVENLVLKSEENIPEIKEELKNKSSIQDKVVSVVSYCLQHKEIALNVVDIAKDMF